MEIKVVVLNLRIAQNIDLFRECRAHGCLVSFLVDKVDDKLWPIVALLCVKMPPERRFLLVMSGFDCLVLDDYSPAPALALALPKTQLIITQIYLRCQGYQRSVVWECT
jgi:hypothetical protein